MDAMASDKLDKLKWLAAGGLVAVGLLVFYFFAEQSLLLRVLILLALIGGAVFIVYGTAKGQQTIGFLQDTYTETRKVIWPTRQETLQTTGIVIVMVLIVALFIWMLDSILMWLVRLITG